eukprot:sb/3465899/
MEQEFCDSMSLRYCLEELPSGGFCPCGKPNTTDHSLSCHLGGYVQLRHIEIRDLTANLLKEAGCRGVSREPHLLPITGEKFRLKSANTANDARLDVAARDFWLPMEKIYTDVRIFNPLAPTNSAIPPDTASKRHEDENERCYNERVLEVESLDMEQEFCDSMSLRYCLELEGRPPNCPCGKPNTTDHSLSCHLGGYVQLRHIEIRDLTANLLKEAGCRGVSREPHLLPITGEKFRLKSANTANDARLDVAARDFWLPMEKIYTDVRIFNPLAPTNSAIPPDTASKRHEDENERCYNERVLEVESDDKQCCAGGWCKTELSDLKAIPLAAYFNGSRQPPKSVISGFIFPCLGQCPRGVGTKIISSR